MSVAKMCTNKRTQDTATNPKHNETKIDSTFFII